MPLSYFTDSVVLITGAASGIGRELALQAAARGAAVLATDLNGAGLEESRQLAQQQGLEMETRMLDVAEPEGIKRFAEVSLPKLKGRRLILINNAGVGLFTGPFAHTELEDFEWLLRINLWGTIWMTKAFYPYLLAQKRGHIVTISSIFGLGGVANQSAYCTSKFAVRGFTETLRMELQGSGITTLVVHPGGVKTPIAKNATPRGAVATASMHQQTVASFEKASPTSAAEAARQILNAIEKRRERLVIGQDGKTFDRIVRLLPVAYTRILKKRIDKVFGDPFARQEAL
jgi:NAD(P)-dependent dehydrogenase (short-subunit alcohol dehydrogenase family)